MNRLQGLSSENRYLVSLNLGQPVEESLKIKEIHYEHPIYDPRSLASQDKIRALSGKNRTFFCGSYLGNGFHEDAVRSSVEVAQKLGVPWGL
jgi:predicted NAD/FAD-binding protein